MRQQVHRSNYEASTPEEYYRVSIYNEFLSHIVLELETRFTESSSNVHGLLYLIPSECTASNVEDCIPEPLARTVDFYKNDLPHCQMFRVEYRMWVRKWKRDGLELPD